MIRFKSFKFTLFPKVSVIMAVCNYLKESKNGILLVKKLFFNLKDKGRKLKIGKSFILTPLND